MLIVALVDRVPTQSPLDQDGELVSLCLPFTAGDYLAVRIENPRHCKWRSECDFSAFPGLGIDLVNGVNPRRHRSVALDVRIALLALAAIVVA